MNLPETLSHYTITAKIGAGGMGEVYRARDTKLDRDVALKILPPHLADEIERTRRFEREAKTIASINHPNIVTIFSVEHLEDIHFLTMELVEGRPLDSLIPPTGMPIAELLDLAIPLCDAVASAHELGITHRDLKPPNVMVDTKGRLKVLDFGLAKVARPPLAPDEATQAVITQESGQIMGTLGYMSPEQAEGREVDPRSDVFSLGIMLYEMAIGVRPFTGASPISVLTAILRDDPPTVHEVRPGLPPEFSRILRRALAKDPERRYQTALGLRNDLKSLQEDLREEGSQSRITSPGRPTFPTALPVARWRRFAIPASVAAVLLVVLMIVKPFRFELIPDQTADASGGAMAVMYFENLADPQDPGRLGEIVTNLLITGLSESDNLNVVSSQKLYDVLKRRGKEDSKVIDRETAGEVAIQAGASTMLVGGILQTSPTYVITSQLVDTNNGKILSSQRIDGKPGEEVFGIIDRLTAEVRKDLRLPEPADGGDISVAGVTTNSMEAYRLYLSGVEKGRQLKMIEARRDLEAAVAIDSTFAMAYYQLAAPGLVEFGNMTREEQRTAATRAARLVDRVTRRERHYILARAARLAGDFDTAISELETLVEGSPDETPAYPILAGLYGKHRKDLQGEIRWLHRWIEIDPTDKSAYNSLAYAYPATGDFERAIWALTQYITLAPDEPNPYDTRGEFHAMMGDLDKAKESFETAIEKDPTFISSYIGLANVLNELGDPEGARDTCRQGMKHAAEASDRSMLRVMLAYIPARQGRLLAAIDDLDAGIRADDMEGYAGIWNRWKLGVRGMMFHYRKDFDRADEDLRKAIATGVEEGEGNAVKAWSSLVLSLISRGQLKTAEKELEDLRAFAERAAPSQMDIYWVCRGWMDLKRGEPDSAFSMFREARKVTNSMFLVFQGLGVAHLACGRPDEAVRELELVTRGTHRSERDSPVQSVLAIYQLGLAYEAAQRPEDAAGAYDRFLRIFAGADPVFEQIHDARTRLERLRPGS